MPSKENILARGGRLQIDVRDLADAPIANAAVTIKPLTGATLKRSTGSSNGRKRGHANGSVQQKAKVKFDKTTHTFTAEGLRPGRHEISISCGGLDPQSREVIVQPGGSEELFILGKKGLPSYFRGQVKMPFDVDPDLIAVTLERNTSEADQKNIFARLARRSDLESVETPELAQRARMQMFRLKKGGAKARREIIARLREDPKIELVGSVVGSGEGGFTHMTDEAVARFKAHITEDEVHEFVRKFGFSVIRSIPYSPNTFHLRSNDPGSVELLSMIEKLAASDEVEWAEPNLVQSPQIDTITPPDVLWQGCWDRQLIGCGDAWQSLQDAGLETYGDPGVIIGVVDSGTQSAAGTPTNPDFQGTVSDGSTKLYQTFDFDNMVANNDSPWDIHGSGVAGIVSARAANPSAIPGQSSGVVGGAPNCRILTIAARIPFVDTEIADTYIWAAGFNPNSPLAGFPAPISPGVDVFTCSLGFGAGAALSGTAKAMLDFVTSFGRGGKGCMCFFSTGNANSDTTTNRPYSAYEKCFGIAATTLANDGVTEIRAPYSGHGKIALSAPSQDATPTLHNPPARYATWAAHHLGSGNMISHRAIETTLTAASAVGANTLSLATVVGLAMNQVIHVGTIGVNGSEPARITSVNAMTNTITVTGWNGGWMGGLLNAHAAGDAVAQGPADHRNNFGGTSSATPLSAGAAAIVLSAEPDLTWVEARQVLRDSAIKFDLTNADPVGQWLDVNGNPSNVSGLPPVRSGWYGYGRVDVDGAVQLALTCGFASDIVVRDNLADTGAVPAVGAFWNSPDIWVRNTSPAMDGAAALPANYATAGPHLAPIAGQPNWLYVRLRNNGSAPSLDCFIRMSITHWPGLEFTYPASFIPTVRPGDPIPSPMTPGTYQIAEVKVSGLASGSEQIVNAEWPAALIPPETVVVGGSTVQWHPCLLVEASPLDGPTTGGNHVWDSNSLCQKNISIVYADSTADFAMSLVAGNEENLSDYLILEIDRGYLPREVQLYVDLVNPILKRRLRTGFGDQKQKSEQAAEISPQVNPNIKMTNGFRIAIEPEREVVRSGGGLALRVPQSTRLEPMARATLTKRQSKTKPFTIGHHEGREVVFLAPRGTTQIPIFGGPGTLHPIVVGGIVGKGAKPGEYSVSLVQRDSQGSITGSAELALTIRK